MLTALAISFEKFQPTMAVNGVLEVFALVLVVMAKVTMSQAMFSSSDGQLAMGQNDCFPGLVYNQQYNACQCVNATLFGEGVVCQTDKANCYKDSFASQVTGRPLVLIR